ncbi:MAG: hypothetical protein WAW03_10435 [Anaerolineae bacterium]
MENIERLGFFYLGKPYDLKTGQTTERPVMYDARDLTTHAVCVGMTGSGKTGLCIDLLEEAAIDRVPAIAIDLKGDITNLLLTFPDLRPADFRAWINLDDARRRNQTEDEFAAATAQTWRDGLAAWGQTPERIRLLRDSAQFLIYTPGSDAGLPVSILHSLEAPHVDWEQQTEEVREQISGTVSALLGLVRGSTDPVRSREHILLSTIFEHFWRQGQNLDLAMLIAAIQNPPVRTLGVADVDTFFPQKDRFNLAMAFNGLMAAPSFQMWLTGQPLDVDQLLYSPDGKPRHSIFYLAHLNDTERMFFVTLLLGQILTWTRSQPGTTSLRALVYMDEIFGYFPPVAEPPSKRPLLTLLKQARAYGVGIVLATQNPVDLDYKGLSNAGTWFVGKLQAQRDKDRLLDGLEGALAGNDDGFDRAWLDKTISALSNRVFLLHNVHEGRPQIFQTRWALSYLRGPLTRPQVRTLMAATKAQLANGQAPAGSAADSPSTPAPAPTNSSTTAEPWWAAAAPTRSTTTPHLSAPAVRLPTAAPRPAVNLTRAALSNAPVLPAEVALTYLPIRAGQGSALRRLTQVAGFRLQADAIDLIYTPAVLGLGAVHFVDVKRGVDQARDLALLLHVRDGDRFLQWHEAEPVNAAQASLLNRPEPDALFADVPPLVSTARALKSLESSFADHLYRSQSFNLWYNPSLKLYSKAGERQREFIIRCQQAAREARDAEVDVLAQKYNAQIARQQTKLYKQQRDLIENETEATALNREKWVTIGETMVGALLGSRRTRVISTTMTKQRLTDQARLDVVEGRQTMDSLRQQISDLQAQSQRAAEAITSRWSAMLDDVREVKVMPRKTDVAVRLVALAWLPVWEITYTDLAGQIRSERVEAWRG